MDLACPALPGLSVCSYLWMDGPMAWPKPE